MREPTPVLSRRDHFGPDGFGLRVIEIHRQTAITLHAHEFEELVLVVDGCGVHYTGDEVYDLKKGDVFVISQGRSHGYGGEGGLHIYNIIYHMPGLALPLHDLCAIPGYHALFTLEPQYRRDHVFESRLRLDAASLATARALVENIGDELTRCTPGYRAAAAADLLRLFVFLSRCYQSQKLVDSSRSLLRIGQAISYLETHPENKVTVADLARLAHVSERTLQRAFQRATGKSVIQYLLDLRIRKAAALLDQENLPIGDVAYLTGFEDSNYFARQFRAAMGRSPSEYRRLKSRR